MAAGRQNRRPGPARRLQTGVDERFSRLCYPIATRRASGDTTPCSTGQPSNSRALSAVMRLASLLLRYSAHFR